MDEIAEEEDRPRTKIWHEALIEYRAQKEAWKRKERMIREDFGVKNDEVVKSLMHSSTRTGDEHD